MSRIENQRLDTEYLLQILSLSLTDQLEDDIRKSLCHVGGRFGRVDCLKGGVKVVVGGEREFDVLESGGEFSASSVDIVG